MDDAVLVSGVEKLMRFGTEAGFNTEELIRILNAGFSVEELLDLIQYRLEKQREVTS